MTKPAPFPRPPPRAYDDGISVHGEGGPKVKMPLALLAAR